MDAGQTWSDEIESVLESLRFNAAHMSEFHKEKYLAAKAKLMFFKIPVIVISGANSVIAVGLGLYVDQRIISATNCLLALACGILGSVELFMGIQSTMELELSVSKQFYLLSIDIYKTLAIKRHERHISGKIYIEQKFQEYARIFATANVISNNVSDSMTVKNPALPSLLPIHPAANEFSSDFERSFNQPMEEDEFEHSAAATHHSSAAAHQSSAAAHQSSTAAHQSSAATHHSSAATHHSAASHQPAIAQRRRSSSHLSHLSISIPDDQGSLKHDLQSPNYPPTIPTVPKVTHAARRSIKSLFDAATGAIDPAIKRLEEEAEEARLAAEEEANRN
jgi:hypothetical protein